MVILVRDIEVSPDEYIEIELFGEPKLDNDSYSDNFGTVKGEDYFIVEDIFWKDRLFSDQVNKSIGKYVKKNYTTLAEQMIKQENG